MDSDKRTIWATVQVKPCDNRAAALVRAHMRLFSGPQQWEAEWGEMKVLRRGQ